MAKIRKTYWLEEDDAKRITRLAKSLSDKKDVVSESDALRRLLRSAAVDYFKELITK